MKIALFGNTANNFHQMALALREQAGIDAYLYLDSVAEITARPESDDPELAKGYPDWIISRKFLTWKSLVMPQRSEIISELSKADLVFLSGQGVRFATHINKPTYFFVTGGDLTILPFPFIFLSDYPGMRAKLRQILIGYRQRQGIKHISEFWTQPFYPFVEAFKRLGIEQDDPRIASLYFPIMLDVDHFKFDSSARQNSDPNIGHLVNNFDFVVFNPSRIMIRDDLRFRISGQWKRTDLLFANGIFSASACTK